MLLLKTAFLCKSFGVNYSVGDTSVSHVSNVWPPLDPKRYKRVFFELTHPCQKRGVVCLSPTSLENSQRRCVFFLAPRDIPYAPLFLQRGGFV